MEISCVLMKKENKKKLQRQARKKNMKLNFINSKSYLEGVFDILKETRKQRKCKKIIILNSNIQINYSFKMIPNELPDNWEVVYLDGVIEENIESEYNNKFYKRVRVSETLGVMFNVENKDFMKKILDFGYKWLNKKGDFWSIFDCKGYIITIPFITPMETRKTNDLESVKYKEIETNVLDLDIKSINDKDLPNVTLVTSTYNNRNMFFLTVMCYIKLNYPKEKLQWIIIDDSDHLKDVASLLPREDDRIVYLRCKTDDQITLGKKLNIAVNNAKYEYIMHFFENNYYNPDSVMTRVKALMSNPGKECVGCTTTGYYNLKDDNSFTNVLKDTFGNKTILYEPSMGYTKRFWEYRPYEESILNDNHRNIVSIPFLVNRYSLITEMKYEFIVIGITNKLRVNEKSKISFYESFPEQIRKSIDLIKIKID